MEEDPSAATTLPNLIKSLASCDAKTRSQSLRTLLTILPTQTQTQIPPLLLKKLWKSLFYCMWHSDKTQNQTNLTTHLTSLLHTLPPPLSLQYFTHFVTTMKREWSGIDHLRLDKFYALVRRFVRGVFEVVGKGGWEVGAVEGWWGGVVEERLLLCEGERERERGDGVGYHVVSVFCEEVVPFLPVGKGVLEVLFRPFLRVLERSENKVLVGKVRGCVFERLVRCGWELVRVRRDGGEGEGEVEVLGEIAVGFGFARRLFELGSREGCVQGNRKVVFALHEEFLRLEKEREKVGFVVSFLEGGEEGGGKMDVDSMSNGDGNEGKEESEEGGEDGKGGGGEKMDVDLKGNGNGEVKKGKKEKKNKKEKKEKKKKKKKGGDGSGEGEGSGSGLEGGVSEANGDAKMVESSEDGLDEGKENGGEDEVEFNETAMSNLQKQFEKIAAESGLGGDAASAIESPPTVEVSGKAVKKRKRSKVSGSAQKGWVGKEKGEGGAEEDDGPKTEGKSAKRVRFSMKNNIVWKPTTPLPPQSVRIPPSVTPRGSALKKGLSPGPIIDASEVKKAKKRVSPLRKAKKAKSLTPRVKRVKKKAKPMSA